MQAIPNTVVGFPRACAPATKEQREVALLEAELTPADVGEAMRALKPMFMLPIQKDADEANFVASFRFVVCDYPLWAIKETVGAFIAGRVATYQSSYCPNTADFGRELERCVSSTRDRLGRARRHAEEVGRYAAEPERQPRSKEVAALGDAMVARLRAAAEEERRAMRRGASLAPVAAEQPFSRPLTKEDLAGVPDAPPRAKDARPIRSHFQPFPKPPRT